jgi:mono/diheme cytochrome c family protein
MTRTAARLCLALALGAFGCGGDSPAPGPKPSPTTTPGQPAGADTSAVSAGAEQEAANIFATRCTPCHGERGRGDGPASAGLVPKPRDFSDPTWQDSVDDQHIERIVLYGGIAVGKAPTMPPNPDLNGKPEVVKALRIHVRGLRGESSPTAAE